VAVFGGSFNPPHVAHVLAAVYVLSTQPVDEVLVVPVYRHPFAKDLAPFADRLAMCRLAFEWIPHVIVSAVEEELGGESLTLRTLEHLCAAHPDWSLRLLIGSDLLADLPKWHRFDRIEAIAPPLIIGRQGADAASAPEPFVPQVSSTEIREALGTGNAGAVRDLVPSRVLAYVAAHGLYRKA
jgi:nicotinate-nucleotide adenylyltransferase